MPDCPAEIDAINRNQTPLKETMVEGSLWVRKDQMNFQLLDTHKDKEGSSHNGSVTYHKCCVIEGIE